MTAPVKHQPTEAPDSAGASAAEWTAEALSDLRRSVNAVAEDLAALVEGRARAVGEATRAGASALRSGIRRQPVLAVSAAALAGALLAVLVVPRPDRGGDTPRWRVRADALPLAASFERLVEALGRVEPEAPLTSFLRKAGAWMQELQARAPERKP